MGSDEFTCPECGTEVSPNARGCPDCGARREGGRWIRSEIYDGLDLPDEDFDYDEFVRSEFGEKTRPRPRDIFWWVVALITLIAFAWIAFRF